MTNSGLLHAVKTAKTPYDKLGVNNTLRIHNSLNIYKI